MENLQEVQGGRSGSSLPLVYLEHEVVIANASPCLTISLKVNKL